MIAKSYQEQQRSRETEPKNADFAKVATVSENGVTLIFDGNTQESVKVYPCNKSVTFTAGQRVRIIKISGTYLVEYPV